MHYNLTVTKQYRVLLLAIMINKVVATDSDRLDVITWSQLPLKLVSTVQCGDYQVCLWAVDILLLMIILLRSFFIGGIARVLLREG